MNNLLSHVHFNAVRRKVLEPEAWNYSKDKEKAYTGDRYYGDSLDLFEAMPPTELDEVIQEITDTRVPPGCSVLPPIP